MITKSGKGLLLACSMVLVTGCIKIQVKPKDVVSDTVSAGKDLYTTIKRKNNGTEERVYTHTLSFDADSTEQELGTACMDHLTATVENASEKDAQILEAGTEVIRLEDGNKMKCTMRVVL